MKSCGGVEGHATRATLSLGRQFARVSGGEIAPAGDRPPPEVKPATGQSVFEAGPQDLTPRRPAAGIPSKGTDHA